MAFGNFKFFTKQNVICYTINFVFLLFFNFSVYSQNVILETKIYDSIDAFVANPTKNNLQNLTVFEKKCVPKTKAEFLALVILNCNKAFYENQFGQTQNAISSYEKGWKLFDTNQLKNYDIIEFCLKPLGNLYTTIGDFENAENTIKHYLFVASNENNLNQKISAIQNLSNVYFSSGKNNQAIQLLKSTLNSEKLSSIQKGFLQNNLANNYLILNEKVLAKQTFESAIKNLEKDKNEPESLSNSYRNLAVIYNSENNFEAANLYYEKAKKLFFLNKNNEPRKVAKIYLYEAKMRLEQNNVLVANQKLQSAFTILIPNYSKAKTLPNQNSLYAETLLVDAFDLNAELFLKQNNPKKALQYFELSFYVENLLQSMLVYENSKILAQISNRNRTEKCIEIYEKLYQNEQNSIYLEKAFQLSEKSKNVVLKTSVQEAKTYSKKQKLALEQLQNQNTIIVKEQQKGNLANIEIINQAIKKQNELMLFLKSNSSEKEILATKSIDLKLVFEKLKNQNASLISYFSGKQKLYAFVFDNDKLSLKSLDYSKVSKQKIKSFLNYFSDAEKITNDVVGFNKSSNSIYNYLQLSTLSKTKNLIIIPDGLLSFLPFEALISKPSSTTNFAKMNFLIHDFSVGYNSSVSFFCQNSTLKTEKETVLGVFPIFENSDLELTYSKDELQSIKNNFNGNYLERKNATFSNFKQNANQFSILHLSTHASSGDIDNPASIRFFDREVFYSELYNLKTNPNLVVLSACETGLGKLYQGEGAMSVSRGFQMAGAQNLLFSLWKVNDFTTSVFMKDFYSNLKNNTSYFEANHKAKLDFLNDETISNSKKSPYFWCAMVYYGSLETNAEKTNWFLILGIALTLIFVIKIVRNKIKK